MKWLQSVTQPAGPLGFEWAYNRYGEQITIRRHQDNHDSKPGICPFLDWIRVQLSLEQRLTRPLCTHDDTLRGT